MTGRGSDSSLSRNSPLFRKLAWMDYRWPVGHPGSCKNNCCFVVPPRKGHGAWFGICIAIGIAIVLAGAQEKGQTRLRSKTRSAGVSPFFAWFFCVRVGLLEMSSYESVPKEVRGSQRRGGALLVSSQILAEEISPVGRDDKGMVGMTGWRVFVAGVKAFSGQTLRRLRWIRLWSSQGRLWQMRKRV